MMRFAPKQLAIAQKYGKPFWSVVGDLHAQGLSRSEAARELGYSVRVFLAIRTRNSNLDPWKARKTIAEKWVEKHNESFEDGIKRLAKHYNRRRVAELMGFKSPTWLEQYIKNSDIDVKFSRSRKPPPAPNLTPEAQSKPPAPTSSPAVHYTRRQACEGSMRVLCV